MTKYEKITESPETLAAAIYGVITTTEDEILERIECATGITIGRITLAPELRIAQITKDLLEEVDDATG
jgi:hypothetical protein